jgi:hypothetical protein
LTSGGQGNGRVAISKLSGTDTCNMKAALAPRALAARTGAAPRPANQTASQPVQHPAIVWVRPQTSLTATAALSGVPEITDTEEITGSNPVSPTSIIPRRGRALRQSPSQIPAIALGGTLNGAALDLDTDPLCACSAVEQRPYPTSFMIDSRSEPMSE